MKRFALIVFILTFTAVIFAQGEKRIADGADAAHAGSLQIVMAAIPNVLEKPQVRVLISNGGEEPLNISLPQGKEWRLFRGLDVQADGKTPEYISEIPDGKDPKFSRQIKIEPEGMFSFEIDLTAIYKFQNQWRSLQVTLDEEGNLARKASIRSKLFINKASGNHSAISAYVIPSLPVDPGDPTVQFALRYDGEKPNLTIPFPNEKEIPHFQDFEIWTNGHRASRRVQLMPEDHPSYSKQINLQRKRVTKVPLRLRRVVKIPENWRSLKIMPNAVYGGANRIESGVLLLRNSRAGRQ